MGADTWAHSRECFTGTIPQHKGRNSQLIQSQSGFGAFQIGDDPCKSTPWQYHDGSSVGIGSRIDLDRWHPYLLDAGNRWMIGLARRQQFARGIRCLVRARVSQINCGFDDCPTQESATWIPIKPTTKTVNENGMDLIMIIQKT